MRKLLCIVPALLLFATISAPNALADSYTVTLTCDTLGAGPCPFGVPPTSTDATFPGGNFTVNVGSVSTFVSFDITLPANFTPTDTYAWAFGSDYVVPPYLSNSVTDFLEIVDETTPLAEFYYVTGTMENLPVYCEECVDGGSVTFSPIGAAAPEPVPVILMLFGLGLIFFTRGRLIMRIPRTA